MNTNKETSIKFALIRVHSRLHRLTSFALSMVLLIGAATTWAASPIRIENQPRLSAVYSPQRTVLIQAGQLNRLLCVPEGLPRIPFALLSRANDIAEISFTDGSVVRQGPNTLVEYIPAANQAAAIGGSLLIRFSEKASLKFNTPQLEGKNALLMVTVEPGGIKVISLMGRAEFKGKKIDEGEMYYDSGQPKMQGPFLIDLAELVHSSHLAKQISDNQWLTKCMEKPIRKQSFMKNMGLVAPTQTMLEGSSPKVKLVNPPVAPAYSNQQ